MSDSEVVLLDDDIKKEDEPNGDVDPVQEAILLENEDIEKEKKEEESKEEESKEEESKDVEMEEKKEEEEKPTPIEQCKMLILMYNTCLLVSCH